MNRFSKTIPFGKGKRMQVPGPRTCPLQALPVGAGDEETLTKTLLKYCEPPLSAWPSSCAEQTRGVSELELLSV